MADGQGRSKVLQEAVALAGLDQDQMTEVMATLGTTEEAVKNLTMEQLRLLLLNALDAVHAEVDALHGKISPSKDAEIVKH